MTAAIAKKNACERICWAYSPSTSGLAASSTASRTKERADDGIGPAEYSARALALGGRRARCSRYSCSSTLRSFAIGVSGGWY